MDSWPICPVCGLWQVMPKQGLPRHMFCIAVRKPSLPLEGRPDIVAVRHILGGIDAGPNQHRAGGGCEDNDCLANPVPHSEAA